jgi:predicted RNA-binding protein associated with RNAse of E/G family
VVYSCSVKELTGGTAAYSALIRFLPGCRELYVDNHGERVCLAGKGYQWLMYLPLEECWCLNAFYSPEGTLLQWYFDISKGNFLDEDKMPCIDDIFLDLVILPDGEAITIDADELQEALDSGVITRDDFNHAYRIHDEILKSKWKDADFLKHFSDQLLLEYADV